MSARTRATGSPGPDAILVGGSAGALAPAQALVAALPEGLGAPVVILLHLARNRPSMLAEVLASGTRRPVREPEDKEPLAAGTIYVAPPDYHLLLAEGPSFALSIDEPVLHSIPSIDVLFESAAETLGAGVAAFLLSGASEDGARGLAAVARAGGSAFVQAPGEAESEVMPEAGARICPSARVFGLGDAGALLAGLAGARGARDRGSR